MAINTYFKNIADAIRTKTEDSGLITPAEMPQTIINLPKGAKWLTPLHTGVKNGYVGQNGNYVLGSQNTYNIYVYDLSDYVGQVVFIFKKTLTGTLNRFRISEYATDPANATQDITSSVNSQTDDTTYENSFKYYNVFKTLAHSTNHYLAVYTGSDALEHEIFVGVANDLLQ